LKIARRAAPPHNLAIVSLNYNQRFDAHKLAR
jgi:hypothetical protein